MPRPSASRRRSTAVSGTTFDCDTKIGPFALTDRMEITEWVDRERRWAFATSAS